MSKGAKKQRNFETRKREARRFYFGVHHVFSPALNGKVHFTPLGFSHLTRNAEGEREQAEQVRRFKLLTHAVTLVGSTSNYDSHYQRLRSFVVDTGQGQEMRTMEVSHWSICGVVKDRRIKVVLRRVGRDGDICFLSVYRDYAGKPRRDKRDRMTEDDGDE